MGMKTKIKTNATKLLSTSACVVALTGAAQAAELEVIHWWTAGGEAAAIAEFASAFEEGGHTWIDSAIAGGSNARSAVVSRLTGGDPMGAFQFNTGRQAEELIEAGLIRDITDIAEAEGWKDIVNPPSLLESCTFDGRVYCVPVNMHSWQWLWLSHKAYDDVGLDVPTNWSEFVAAAPVLREAGKQPLVFGGEGWQRRGLFNVLLSSLVPTEVFVGIYGDKNTDIAASAEVTAVFEAAATAREMGAGSNVQNWNDATGLVISGMAGGQVMGDWAQGEFALAGSVAGEDYTCLPGLGENALLSTGGDSFYFPVLDDADKSAAQADLAKMMLSKEAQVSFNLAKGSLPVRGDVDLAAANDCMKKGLDLLAEGALLPDVNQLATPDTVEQINSLFIEFFADESYTIEAAQADFVKIIASAK